MTAAKAEKMTAAQFKRAIREAYLETMSDPSFLRDFNAVLKQIMLDPAHRNWSVAVNAWIAQTVDHKATLEVTLPMVHADI